MNNICYNFCIKNFTCKEKWLTISAHNYVQQFKLITFKCNICSACSSSIAMFQGSGTLVAQIHYPENYRTRMIILLN
jgi:hypothetical protein